MYEDRNRFYRLFHGQPIPVEWQGWRSDTHALDRQGWQIMAEEEEDHYSACRLIRLGLLSPEKTLMVTGIHRMPYQAMKDGLEIVEMMHRFGFTNMGVIHKRDVHKVMMQPEFLSIDSMKTINPHEPTETSAIDLYRGTFKFFNYADSDPKEIIIPPNNVEECLNQILKLQYPEQKQLKSRLIMPDKAPIIQAKILSLAA